MICSCNAQSPKSSETNDVKARSLSIGDTVAQLGKNLGCIFQDRYGHYWFASNGEGVFRYDGKVILQITEQHGLCSNYVTLIEADPYGKLWFSTRDGVCSLNGSRIESHTSEISQSKVGKLTYTRGGLFLQTVSGLCFYNGFNFTRFSIQNDAQPSGKIGSSRAFNVYSKLVDNKGNVWFGTEEKGVCVYNGTTFTYYSDHGLDKAAVRTLYQDRKGTIWAGNNGAGLFRFDGQVFMNFTDSVGLTNPEFLRSLKSKEGTLARPWCINEDDLGNLWIGTMDSGLWRYDGQQLINFTIKDGLSGNAVWAIYKNQKGELLFLVNGQHVCRYDGSKFVEFKLN